MARPERVLDVSHLEPPEPLTTTLQAAQQLPPGHYLRMLHRRHPCLLPENLERRGFSIIIRDGRRTAVEALIWRSGDGAAAAAVRAAAESEPL